jgi:RNA polymerase sigma factor for flagellar operon FliA
MTPNQIAAKYGALVRTLARRLASQFGSSVEADDLAQEGMLALLECGHSLDVDELMAYAYVHQRVTGAMQDSLRRRDNCSRLARRRTKAIAKAEQTLRNRLDRCPTHSEIAKEAGIDLRTYFAALARAFASNDGAIDEFVEDTAVAPTGDPLSEILRAETLDQLDGAFWCIPERQRRILIDRYMNDAKLREIAEELGVTESRVSQLETAALENMRCALAEIGCY